MLIALYAPRQGSGKSVIADALVQDHGFSCIKFADPLKEMIFAFLVARGLDPFTVERMVHGDLKEAPVPGLGGITTRFLMQTIGTEWGRNTIHPDIWTNTFRASVEATPGPVVCDDMRFPNEYETAADLGAVLVRVIRAGHSPEVTHPSEGLLDDRTFHHTIINDSTLEVLRHKARHILCEPETATS